jgi:trk system potassium uptake protein TrkH
MINYRIVLNILGLLFCLNGLFMLSVLPASFYYHDGTAEDFIFSGIVCFMIGSILVWFTRNASKNIGKREGYLIVTLGWLALVFSGAFPHYFSGRYLSFTDAFFETMAGYTTTGASILTDIESMPEAILLWRSITHWIGGMGIIVLTLAILPLLGIGGMQLFMAESPGVTADKLHPRITETAKRLWAIYVFLTGVQLVLLMVGGMGFFDAANHAMSTLSTGGFSTKNASVAHFDSPFIQWVIIVFMYLAGINFSLTYFAMKGRLRRVWQNEEFRFYTFLMLIVGVFVSLVVYWNGNIALEKAFRDGFFQVASIVTTTGFATADYTSWTPFLTLTFFWLMFMGASAGSTSGGVKLVRHAIILKNSWYELKRLIHPSAVIPVKLNNRAVSTDIVFNVMSFFLIYMIIFIFGGVVMSFLGLDFESALGSSIACLGNIGPGLGSVGPVGNYAHIGDAGKWFLSFLMLLGRLELFTVLILLSPYFWRKF